MTENLRLVHGYKEEHLSVKSRKMAHVFLLSISSTDFSNEDRRSIAACTQTIILVVHVKLGVGDQVPVTAIIT